MVQPNTEQFQETINIAQFALTLISRLLCSDPMQKFDDKDIKLGAEQLICGKGLPTELAHRIPELLAHSYNHAPGYKAEEMNIINEIFIRALMSHSPQHFSTINDGQPITHETWTEIIHEFMKEFANGGVLQSFEQTIKKEIQSKSIEDSSSILEFFSQLINIIRYICSDDIKNPLADPLLYGLNEAELKKFMALEKWIPTNRQNPKFSAKHRKYKEIKRKIRESKTQNIKMAIEKIFFIFEKMLPEMANYTDIQVWSKDSAEQSKRSKYSRFVKYFHTFCQRSDILEPNYLRNFWETIYRLQYGEFFYRMVCESFEDINKDCISHQLAKKIWAVSILDIANETPLDARSRMPGKSSDGKLTINFGYAMDNSSAHQQWYSNPLTKACGDVIIDLMQRLVDFLIQLNIDVFIERFKRYLEIGNIDLKKIFGSDDESYEDENEALNYGNQMIDYYENPHPYDEFMLDFTACMLKLDFDIEAVCDYNHHPITELLKVGGEIDVITEKATQHIQSLVAFSKKINALRPDDDSVDVAASSTSFVFGIGFKGQRFGAGGQKPLNRHEIHLAFSKAGRNEGGRCFLELLKAIAKKPTILGEKVYTFNIPSNYKCYRDLIQAHLQYKLSYLFHIIDNDLCNLRYQNITIMREKFEKFLIQCEEKIEYDQLTQEFKIWLNDLNQWYCIPFQFSIIMPETLSKDEYAAHNLARVLIFDVVARRSFSKAYPELMPTLYRVWQEKLLRIPRLKDVVAKENNYAKLSKEYQNLVNIELDKLILQIHPDLKKIWQADVDVSFSQWHLKKENEMEKIKKSKRRKYNKSKKKRS